MNTPLNNQIMVGFCDGARVDIVPAVAASLHGSALQRAREATYSVRFLNADNDLLVYSVELTPGCFGTPFPKYFIRWRIVVEENGQTVYDQTLDLAGKKVYIQLDSKALGDSIAWFPYVEEFRKKHQCDVHVGSFRKELFQGAYPTLVIRDPGVSFAEFDAAYIVGSFDNNHDRNKNNWRLIPLQQVATDCLGLPFQEIRPKIARGRANRPVEGPYVAIAEFSTFDAKEWLHPGGWRDVVGFLKDKGYQVVSVSKETTHLEGVITQNDRSLTDTVGTLQQADFFIGVSSGLAWLAWALEVPTIIVSGFTEAHSEMADCYRVINKSVCTGCYNDRDLPFDRGNRRWCPRNKNMECSTSITPAMVQSAIERLLRDKAEGKKAVDAPEPEHKVLFLLPHCSTGGMPQYAYQCVKGLVNAGSSVAVAEWQDIAPAYNVQKRRIQDITCFYTLKGDWTNLQRLIDDFAPDVVHLQEFAETFLPAPAAEWLFRSMRPYMLIETTHGRATIQPDQKRWLPDAFVFANQYHVKQFEHLKIPIHVVEHQVAQRVRPDRAEALGKLGLDPERRHILNVGLFTPGKNQGLIFELARELPDLSFHFVGNQAGNFAAYWEPLMARKPDNCIVWGERSDTDLFYAAMDLFLFPSTNEFNPIVLKEALAWQMPVIMRNMETYCGSYDGNPLVTFFDDGSDMAALIRYRFPSPGGQLTAVYRRRAPQERPERTERVVVTERNDIGGWMEESNKRVLDELIKKHRIRSVVEIGSFLGLSAAWFAKRVNKVTCVDTWYEAASRGNGNNLVNSLHYFGVGRDFYAKFVENMKACGAWPKITPVRGDSREVASVVEEADLVYIDANHTREGCASDIQLYFPKARKIICGDDYVVRPEFGVIEAVSDLLPRHKSDAPFWWAYTPSVAVIIPNKNFGPWLGEAILSAQAQTIPPMAVVVVDGGSEDNSETVTRMLGASWVPHEGRMGAAKNHGIAWTAGAPEYIVTLDADDWIEPTFIERSIEQMPGNDIVATQMRLEDGAVWMPAVPFTVEHFVERNLIFTTSLFRRSLWERLGGFSEDPECYEDWDFWLRAVLSGAKIGVVSEPLFHHTEHPASSCAQMTPEMDARYRHKIRMTGTAVSR